MPHNPHTPYRKPVPRGTYMSDDDLAPVTGRQAAERLATDSVFRERVSRWAASRLGIEESRAGDLLQETLIEVLKTQSPIENAEAFGFHVFQTRCYKLLRSSASRPRIESLDDAAFPEPMAPPSGIGLDRIFIAQALARVSKRCRELLALHYLEGRSLKETAAVQGLQTVSVSVLINRCLQKLRTCLSIEKKTTSTTSRS